MMDRTPHFHYGPRFFRDENGRDMFEHRIDSRNLIGPRLATKVDKRNHEGLWLAHLEAHTKKLDDELHVAKPVKKRFK